MHAIATGINSTCGNYIIRRYGIHTHTATHTYLVITSMSAGVCLHLCIYPVYEYMMHIYRCGVLELCYVWSCAPLPVIKPYLSRLAFRVFISLARALSLSHSLPYCMAEMYVYIMYIYTEIIIFFCGRGESSKLFSRPEKRASARYPTCWVRGGEQTATTTSSRTMV